MRLVLNKNFKLSKAQWLLRVKTVMISHILVSVFHIGDGVIGPSGNIIATDPADFLMATKDPAGLASDLGGGSSNSEQRKTNSLLTALLNKSLCK